MNDIYVFTLINHDIKSQILSIKNTSFTQVAKKTILRDGQIIKVIFNKKKKFHTYKSNMFRKPTLCFILLINRQMNLAENNLCGCSWGKKKS